MTDLAINYDDAETLAGLARVRLLLTDLRPFWPTVVGLFTSWVSRQFEDEGSFFGDAWAPLSPEYAAWKTQHFPGKGLLSAEGDLRRAATTPRRLATPTELILEIPPYPKGGRVIDPDWFQSGTDRMPARPLLWDDELPGRARSELDVAAVRYVDEMLSRFGLLSGRI